MTKMRKMKRIVLAVLLVLSLMGTAALADEAPQPEGGRKYESDWAMMCGLIEIVYEEEGYRVSVDLFNQDSNTGTLWEYSCYYNDEKDILESVSSRKITYAMNPLTMDRAFDEYEYEGIDDPEQTTVFSLSEDGALRWADGHENRGQDLEFRDIGCFEGVWRNDAEAVYTEFLWEGLCDENMYCYSVYVGRGDENMHFIGLYDPESGKLVCYDTDASPFLAEHDITAEDFFAAQDEGKPYDAVFTALGNGKLLYEIDHGIELEYDILGPES